ncbi:ABC transporter ATP-binding protein [Cryobacterium sinapicolor]|uniref:ABC transporter ATP-binding protein n=1 Tax=Cryobacterium sinapicolor TaxID=1259236 RepID=UPI001F53F269|nr:ABC transporter ATP-binding protein [Cryobacterium sinapicolor]
MTRTAPRKPAAPPEADPAGTLPRNGAPKGGTARPPAARTTATTTSARTTSARATAARTAAAKSESVEKTGAARSSAAKASAARAAATRAATLAAAAAAAANVSEPDPVLVDPVLVEPERVEPERPEPEHAESKAAEPESEQTEAEQTEAEQSEAEQSEADEIASDPATQVPPEHFPAAVESAEPAMAETSVAESSEEETSVLELGAAASGQLSAAAETELLPPAVSAATKRPGFKRVPRKRAPVIAPAAIDPDSPVVLSVTGLQKSFGQTVAVSGIDLEVRAGSFFGIVGPNGAGKTTTLSMVTGLLRPDAGSVTVNGIDVWGSPIAAKRIIGVLPDRLRLFDRLTGAQLLYYSGVLRGLDDVTVRQRAADLATAFGLEDALNRLVADYSAGMTKKIALACAMIHSPRLLVLDEPFESVDPVSAVNVTEILQKYVASGGTVVLSSHGMDLIQRVCDHVAIIVQGAVLASGTIDEVRGEKTLEERFIELAGGRKVAEGMEWLHSFSD